MRYNLSDYVVSIVPNGTLKNVFGEVTVGGNGSYLGSISVNSEGRLFQTDGFATGAWVHNKSLDRHGSISISVSQLAEFVAKMKQLCNIYYAGDYDGLTIVVKNSTGEIVCTCIDCYPASIPNQEYNSTAGTQSWSLTAGQVTFQ